MIRKQRKSKPKRKNWSSRGSQFGPKSKRQEVKAKRQANKAMAKAIAASL
tara:strand:+ start:377 stop:526 length:150 start_codon:yes stop_codon:yes gene_type:complete